MKPKHTPGPWRPDQQGERVYAGEYKHGTQVHVCNVFDPIEIGPTAGVHAPNKEGRKANARLIAAAPDLLEALISIVNSCELSSGADIDARKVIAKATGGSNE